MRCAYCGKAAALGLAGAAAGLALWLAPPSSSHQIGSLSSHMLQHVLLMNAVAPAIAYVLCSLQSRPCAAASSWLVPAAAVQILLIWAWHTPRAFLYAHEHASLMMLMHVSLLASAIAFWMSVAGVARQAPWKAILALLVTGKLFCLFGAVLIFAPRVLFEFAHAHGVSGHLTLDDQHLAGLVMVTACPLTYVAAALAIAAHWLRYLGPPVCSQAAVP